MRVLVTRSQEDAERTAKRLQARGHEALLAPLTRIVPTEHPMPEGPFDGFVVTSAHGAGMLSPLPCKDMPVFAVGPHTASALREAGFSRVLVADGEALSLAALIRRSLKAGASLCHVTGLHHKNEPSASLRAAGYRVIPWAAYEAKALPGLPSPAREALRTGQIAAALHYSQRSARIFLQLTEEAGLTSILRTFPHLCLSADVAVPFDGLGIRTLPASQPDETSLLALLDNLPARP